jgi:hypothetical protein
MKIEIFQYKPEVIRKITKSSKIVGKWFEGFNGIIILGQKIHKKQLMGINGNIKTIKLK